MDQSTTMTAPGRLTYRISELATMLGVSVKTLDRMRRDGSFPPPDQHAGRALLWRVSTIDEWLSTDSAGHKRETGSTRNSRKAVKSGA
jgi:predicted DNA-binding transcriptional regulator AlpA